MNISIQTQIAIEEVCNKRHFHLIKKGKSEREASNVIIAYLNHLEVCHTTKSKLPFGCIDWSIVKHIENLRDAYSVDLALV